MSWTTEKPTEPGWYWVRYDYANGTYDPATLAEVVRHIRDRIFLVNDGWAYIEDDDGRIQYQFAGPIPGPKE